MPACMAWRRLLLLLAYCQPAHPPPSFLFSVLPLPAYRPLSPLPSPTLTSAVFPDTLMEGRSCVLATFDNDPLADLEAAQRLPAEQRARMSQVGAWRPAWWSLFFSDDGAADGGAGAGGCGLTVCSATAPAVTWLAHFSNRSLTPLAPPKNPISVSCAAGLSAQVVQGPQGQAVCGAAGAPDPARAGVSGLPFQTHLRPAW